MLVVPDGHLYTPRPSGRARFVRRLPQATDTLEGHPLTVYVEKRNPFQPPRLASGRKEAEAWQRQPSHPVGEVFRRPTLRENLRGWGFGQSKELAEEPPFGQQLVLHDLQNRAGAWMRPKGHLFRGELFPDRDHLVRLGGVDIKQVLENRRRGTWNDRIWKG